MDLVQFTITEITDTVAGVPTSPTVTAYSDAGSTVMTDYVGTVTFTSSDGAAIFPTPYTFLVGDSGVHTFTGGVTLKTTGERTVTVTDGAVSATQADITVTPAAINHFHVEDITDPVVAGITTSPKVTAHDIYHNVKTDYTAEINFSSDDTIAVLPLAYTFIGGDSGVHTFTSEVILKTTGDKYVTVTSTVEAKTGTQSGITVNPAALDHYTMTGMPATCVAGTAWATPANDVIVTAFDEFDNTKTDYAGQVYFTSTDGAAVLPYTSGSKYQFVAGTGTYTFIGSGFTLKTITGGLKTITVTDGTKSLASGNITITPGAIHHFTLTGIPAHVISGSSVLLSPVVTAFDNYTNVKTDYTGTVAFTSSDVAVGVVLPANHAFIGGDNGTHTFPNTVKLITVGAQSVTATDTVTSKTGSQTGIDVFTTPSAPVLNSIDGDTTVTLSWTTPASGGTGVAGGSAIQGYRVYRGIVPAGETLLASVGAVNTYPDSGLTNNTVYYYKVLAYNLAGNGALSNENEAKPEVSVSVAANQNMVANGALNIAIYNLTGSSSWTIIVPPRKKILGITANFSSHDNISDTINIYCAISAVDSVGCQTGSVRVLEGGSLSTNLYDVTAFVYYK